MRNDASTISCSRCLMGLFGTDFEIGTACPNVLCRECADLEANPFDVSFFLTELREILQNAGMGNRRHVLAYSGGLDSTVAIKLLATDYEIRPELVHIDNGFRTEKVWKNISRIQEHFGLKLEIVRRSIVDIVRREYPPGTIFCGADCSERWLMPALREVCTRYGVSYCLTGNEAVRQNSVLRPSSPPLVSILAAHPMTREQRLKYVSDLPWEDPGIYGYDSDCIYAGWALAEYHRVHGRWPEVVITYLSRRIRLGLCGRDEELATLKAGPQVPREQFGRVRGLLDHGNEAC